MLAQTTQYAERKCLSGGRIDMNLHFGVKPQNPLIWNPYLVFSEINTLERSLNGKRSTKNFNGSPTRNRGQGIGESHGYVISAVGPPVAAKTLACPF
jgi:hypothetical protein